MTLRQRLSQRQMVAQRPGQAMLEMALVVMILVVLCFGIADFGLYFQNYVSVANCTREAARNAAVRGTVPSCWGVTVAYADPAHNVGSQVTATVNTTHNWLFIGYLIPGFPTSIDLKSHTSMRMEGTPI